jgi:peptide/nickel transport system substrate-binding protein
VVGSGPYRVATYIPGRWIVLVRNPNWDAATDPLRKAWVDRIEITPDVPIASIQRSIDREEADLSLDSHVPQARVAALRADPERSPRLSVNTTGILLFLVLQTDRRAGAIADVRVRRAINYAIDKVAYRDAVVGRFAPTGELASTILAPGSLGYRHYDLYPTPGGRGDPAKARALLADAGYPNGLTLTFVAWGSGSYVDTIKPVRDSLVRAGIRLKLKTYKENDLFDKSLAIPAERLEHQVGQGIWGLDYLGDNARQ